MSEGGREGVREGGREGGRERGREGEREGGRGTKRGGARIYKINTYSQWTLSIRTPQKKASLK